MTFPVVAATANTAFSANQTSHVINLPASIAPGNLLILWFSRDNTSGTVTTPTGWTLSAGPIAATDSSYLYTRTADGAEGATVTITSSTSESSTAIAMRITGWTEAAYASTTATSQFANPATVAATETAESLVICCGSALGSTTVSISTNGPVTSLFEAGNPADANNTVSAAISHAQVCTTNGANVVVIPWHWSSSIAHRLATAVIHGTPASSGFPLSRLVV